MFYDSLVEAYSYYYYYSRIRPGGTHDALLCVKKKIMGYPEIISNIDLYARTGQCPISTMAKHDRWKLLGHILRQPDIPASTAMNSFCIYATNQPFRIGAPRSCLTTTLQRDVRFTPICIFKPQCLHDLRTYAHDRKQWTNICSAI